MRIVNLNIILSANGLQSVFLIYKYIFTLKCTYFFVKKQRLFAFILFLFYKS
nr:MAG TPA: hypothetical protein [Caudoviricetes sp.]